MFPSEIQSFFFSPALNQGVLIWHDALMLPNSFQQHKQSHSSLHASEKSLMSIFSYAGRPLQKKEKNALQ